MITYYYLITGTLWSHYTTWLPYDHITWVHYVHFLILHDYITITLHCMITLWSWHVAWLHYDHVTLHDYTIHYDHFTLYDYMITQFLYDHITLHDYIMVASCYMVTLSSHHIMITMLSITPHHIAWLHYCPLHWLHKLIIHNVEIVEKL